MQRLINRSGQLGVDLAVLVAAYALAFALRFEGVLPPGFRSTAVVTLPYVVGVQYLLLLGFGVTRVAWRYFSLADLGGVVRAFAVASALMAGGRLGIGALHESGAHPGAGLALIPFGIILIDITLAFLGIAGVRVLRRMLAERTESDSRRATLVKPSQPTVLIGAGRAGAMVAKEIASRPDLGIEAVCFVDDDPVKVGTVVHGIPVVGTSDDLVAICAKREVNHALVTIAAAPGSTIRRLKEVCDGADIRIKIIPGVFEIVGGQVNLSRIRDVAIDDLLRRAPVQLDEEAIDGVVRNRTVLVTGAGGSIGSEICRQVARFSPAHLILVEQAENPLFHIERELRAAHADLRMTACIADICDAARVDSILAMHSPNVVFHAAAHKHVPLMEGNPGEAVKNNVFGTRVLADAADAHGVREFVMISSDKAVNPTSVMGATKRIAEIYIQSLSQRSKTCFIAVRFGNVLGSAGSVVPIFQEQIGRGGPITITHPEMTRYFMTIPEATQLVLEAAALGRGGEIFILDMGEPVKVVDLAKDLLALSGLREGEDVEIVFTGLRPGEKLFEELSTDEEQAERTRHPKVFTGRIKPHDMEHVEAEFVRLREAVAGADEACIRKSLTALVPEYGVGHASPTGSRREATSVVAVSPTSGARPIPAPQPRTA